MSADAIDTILVAGGGVMGSGIALVCALGGKRVRMLDVDAAALERSRRAVADKWRFMADMALVRVGSERLLQDIAYLPAGDLEIAAAGADLCFEALPDDLELKRRFVGQLNEVLAPHAPIATNSGNLLVDDIVAPLATRARVLSAHWINPPHVMPPVEVCPGTDTDPAAVRATVRCLRDIGKLPLQLRRDIPGRIANRLHFALLNEAIKLLEEDVASAEDIDTVARYTFVMRHALFGPLGAHDLYGRKGTSLQILEYLQAATGNPVYAPTALHRERASLEQEGRAEVSRWRRNGLPERRQGDEQVVALMKFLSSFQGGGR